MKKLFFFMLSCFTSLSFAIGPFTLQWMNASTPGDFYKSSDYTNAVFVVENYFQGCGPCNDNEANIIQLASDFASSPRVQVLDVGIDESDESYALWIQDHKPNHPVLKDATYALTGQLGTTGFPSTYVISQGVVHYTHAGVWEPSVAAEIRKIIRQLTIEEGDFF